MTSDSQGGSNGVTRIAVTDVFDQEPGAAGRELGPLARTGYKLALFLLLYLSAVTAFLLVEYFVNAPSLPSGPPFDQGAVAQYQQLSEINQGRTLQLLDSLVLKGFLPVFTAVLGYIFGTRGIESGEV